MRNNRDIEFLEDGELGLFFGRPAIGKTSMAYNIVLSAGERGLSCYYYSLEQTNNELFMGLVGANAGIDRKQVSGANVELNSTDQLSSSIKKVGKLPIHLVGIPNFIDGSLLHDLNERQIAPGSLIVIDYLQLAKSSEDSEFLPALKDFAVTGEVKLLVLSQIQRLPKMKPLH